MVEKIQQGKMQDKSKDNLTLTEVKAEARQSGNQQWWTDNTMSYDWTDKSGLERFSKAWYDDIDLRFLYGARLFMDASNPFVSLMGLEGLKGKRVLEIGCGMGMHSEMLLRAGAKLTSIDLSPTSIESTSRRLALAGIEGDVRHMDAENLAFDDNTFDLVWSWGVIHHSSSTSKVLKGIYRVLKPGGEAKIMVYALDGASAWATMMFRYSFGFWAGKTLDDLLWRDSDGFSARFYTKDNWRDLVGMLFHNIEIRLFGQDADAIPVPRQIRKPLLALFSTARLREMAGKRGSMLYSTSVK